MRERKLVAVEIATATRRSERTVATMINDAEQLVHEFPARVDRSRHRPGDRGDGSHVPGGSDPPVGGEPTMVTRHWGRAAADTFRDTNAASAGSTTGRESAGREQAGRERYVGSPELRLVLAAIDETCRFPGCGRRANRCELDHARDWAHEGATTAENLTYLCSRHHHLKHDIAWTVESDPDRPRHLNWRSPHGRTYSTAPPRGPNG